MIIIDSNNSHQIIRNEVLSALETIKKATVSVIVSLGAVVVASLRLKYNSNRILTLKLSAEVYKTCIIFLGLFLKYLGLPETLDEIHILQEAKEKLVMFV